ncbi:hypothetical protein HBB16_05965 [Pseudonocardia sp. MCCB 268]|nr:hypothetical protein [Pseudonocardia cytotoxica]
MDTSSAAGSAGARGRPPPGPRWSSPSRGSRSTACRCERHRHQPGRHPLHRDPRPPPRRPVPSDAATWSIRADSGSAPAPGGVYSSSHRRHPAGGR